MRPGHHHVQAVGLVAFGEQEVVAVQLVGLGRGRHPGQLVGGELGEQPTSLRRAVSATSEEVNEPPPGPGSGT